MIANFITKNHPVSKMAKEMGFGVETEVNSEIKLILRKKFDGDPTTKISEAISESNFIINYAKECSCTVPLFSATAVDGLADVVCTVAVPFDWYWKRVD